jgi:hypothetical protein
MVIEALNPENAANQFRERLRQIKRSGYLFGRPTTIYLEGFVPLTGSYETGLLVNWESCVFRSTWARVPTTWAPIPT